MEALVEATAHGAWLSHEVLESLRASAPYRLELVVGSASRASLVPTWDAHLAGAWPSGFGWTKEEALRDIADKLRLWAREQLLPSESAELPPSVGTALLALRVLESEARGTLVDELHAGIVAEVVDDDTYALCSGGCPA